MEVIDFELIMINAFDAIAIALFEIVIDMLPTILLVVGIMIVIKVAVSFFSGILLEDKEAREKEDKREENRIERELEEIERFMEDWS